MLLGQRISHERERRGWTRSHLARKAGLDPSYVTRIEEAKFQHPSIDKVRALAAALSVDLSTLTEPPPSNDDDALLRKLIERRVGLENGQLVATILEKVRGRPPADQQTVLSVLDVLMRSFDQRN